MGTRKVIKAKANKKSRSAQVSSSDTLSGGSHNHRVLPTGHVKKAKHHQAQEGHHKEQSRNLNVNRDNGKAKARRGAPRTGTGSTGRPVAIRQLGARQVAEHDKAAAKHGSAKRAHIKAAKSRKKK